jgi:hypothetical protein
MHRWMNEGDPLLRATIITAAVCTTSGNFVLINSRIFQYARKPDQTCRNSTMKEEVLTFAMPPDQQEGLIHPQS